MTDTQKPAQADRARRLQVKRRVKRGIVASYIHQLSERHNENANREQVRAEAVAEVAEEQAA